MSTCHRMCTFVSQKMQDRERTKQRALQVTILNLEFELFWRSVLLLQTPIPYQMEQIIIDHMRPKEIWFPWNQRCQLVLNLMEKETYPSFLGSNVNGTLVGTCGNRLKRHSSLPLLYQRIEIPLRDGVRAQYGSGHSARVIIQLILNKAKIETYDISHYTGA